MPDLQFHIEGEQAEATAAALEALISELFCQAPRREPRPVSSAKGQKADAWVMTAVILALPGAINATADLAERLRLKERLQRLTDFAQHQRQIRSTRIWLRRGNRIEPLPLDEARLSDLLDE